ncbi:hypothetical protein [Portibacter marinus]|uniref:hypothetical protein n=1 Tax=Portibacter marinus TaxID=2898660 RepID=UPI001F1E82E2|nr:hypothetical protein [Portibacter marinus]
MRIVGYIEHPVFKITIMHMNHRYALKFEHHGLEQTYKIRASDHFKNAEDVKNAVSTEILDSVKRHFRSMELTMLEMLTVEGTTEEEEFEEII